MAPPPPRDFGLIPHILIILGPMHEEKDDEGEEEEDAIHDAKRETGLLHRAVLLHAGRESAGSVHPVRAHAEIGGAGVTDAGTIGRGDAAELVHAGDEGADEADVDKGDEEGGSVG